MQPRRYRQTKVVRFHAVEGGSPFFLAEGLAFRILPCSTCADWPQSRYIQIPAEQSLGAISYQCDVSNVTKSGSYHFRFRFVKLPQLKESAGECSKLEESQHTCACGLHPWAANNSIPRLQAGFLDHQRISKPLLQGTSTTELKCLRLVEIGDWLKAKATKPTSESGAKLYKPATTRLPGFSLSIWFIQK